MGLRAALAALLLVVLSSRAPAESCWDHDHVNYDCGKRAGVGLPLGADSLVSNPAALPVSSDPFGLDFLVHSRTPPKGRPNFTVATTKGFDGIGFGVGSYLQGSFAAPNFRDHFYGTPAGAPTAAWSKRTSTPSPSASAPPCGFPSASKPSIFV